LVGMIQEHLVLAKVEQRYYGLLYESPSFTFFLLLLCLP
jgi:hypothetical protein